VRGEGKSPTVGGFEAFGNTLPAKTPFHVRARGSTDLTSFRWIRQQFSDGGGKRRGVALRDDDPGALVLNHSANPAGTGGDERRP
jgi:hypothetical protein